MHYGSQVAANGNATVRSHHTPRLWSSMAMEQAQPQFFLSNKQQYKLSQPK